MMAATLSASAATYDVGSISALTARINAALPGDEIVVSNGVYTTTASLGISRAGSAANRILIRAETVGGVEITGTHGFSFNTGAAYVTVQGFKFTHAGSINMTTSAHHCRLTRNLIELTIPATNDVSYVNISGDDMEVDRNDLRNKSTLGNMLDITGTGGQVAWRLWVHHNYFHDFTSPGGNGAETIRWGLSGLSLSTGDGLCEYNLFVRCDGENEMISNKSSGNTYRYNTVIDAREISQRHGNDCLYYGNYMRNSEGIRVYGDRHRIFNNYFETNSVGVNMGNGDGDVYNGAALTAHDRPDDNVVAFNTFIGNNTHYQMGGRTGGLGSSNTVVANNIFVGGGNMAGISSSAPYTGSWSNNIRWNTSSAGNMPASAYTNLNPLLAKDANGVYHIQAGSPAINAGKAAVDYYGVPSTFADVAADMDGQTRDASKDIGADEFSTAPVTAKMLTTNDVGPNSLASGFSLNASPTLRTATAGQSNSVSYAVAVNEFSASNGVVALSVAGLPANASASFAPAMVTNVGNSVLNVTVAPNTPLGNFQLTITGSAPNFTNATFVTLGIVTNLLPGSGLVARLTFDDDTANDSSGYGNHGTVLNGASIVTDATRGKVLSLDGTDDYVDLGNGASLNVSDSNQVTITAWVKPAISKNHNTILSKGEWKEAYALVIKGDTTPDDELWTGNDTSVFSGGSVPIGVWSHVAMVVNNDLTTFYLNGQVTGAADQDRGNPLDDTATGVSIGREQYTGSMPAGRWFFNGQLDDVRIYKRALTQIEIQSVMTGSPTTPPRIDTFALNGSTLTLRGTNGVPSATCYVLASTDLTLPLPNWVRVATNQFDSNGACVFDFAMSPDLVGQFFALQLP